MKHESSSLLQLRIVASFPAVFAAAVFLLVIIGIVYRGNASPELNPVSGDRTLYLTHRRLLNQGPSPFPNRPVEPDRIWSEKCSKSDVVITQGATEPLPNGIPTYTVEIINICPSGCDISAVHLSCGWFSSARLVNPRVFKRLHFDDCLVNDGKPLVNGRTLSFQYANTFPFPLSVTSVTC